MKISVDTKKLTEKVEKVVNDLEKNLEKEQKEYEKTVDKELAKVRKLLLEVAENLSAKDVDDGYISVSRGRVTIEADLGSFPRAPSDTIYKYRRDLEALKMSDKATLSVGPDDHLWKYLSEPEKGTR